MDIKETLAKLRSDIDQTDAELVKLFDRRMKLSDDVARVKSAGNLPITDEKREDQVVANAMALSGLDDKTGVATFMRTLIALSKARQHRAL